MAGEVVVGVELAPVFGFGFELGSVVDSVVVCFAEVQFLFGVQI